MEKTINELLETKGRIFDIQRFSIHDGPGIRTIIFLKGCRMRCRWCCNPESQEYEIGKIVMGGKEKIVGRDVTVRETLSEVEKDRVYYRRSGGGLTISGGECTTQPDFTEALLRCAQEYGLNTAIETTAFADREIIERIIPYVDTVLMDIKHMDSEKHKEFTRAPNEKILENAKYIGKNAKKLIIRTPVIPGFNASEREIEAIASFAKTIENVDEMHILPYHRIGMDKYKGLGRPYLMGDVKPPSKEEMEKYKQIVLSQGLKCRIGG